MTRKDRARQTVVEQMDTLIAISQQMHDNPELAYEEHETANLLTGYLENIGFAIEKPAYGLETAWAARAAREGPTS